LDVNEQEGTADGIRRIRSSISDTDAVRKALHGQDAVFHLAAVVGVHKALNETSDLREINLDKTRELIDIAIENGIKKFVFSSSSEVYGNSTEEFFREDGELKPVSEYGRYKIEIEKYLRAKADEGALSSTVVRFFNVYGPGQRKDFVVNRFIDLAEKGEALRVNWDGEQVRCYTYVGDAVRGIRAALAYDKKPFDIFNIGNPRKVSVLALAKAVLDVHATSMSDIIIVNKNKVDRYDIARRVPFLDKSERELGYVPIVSLEEGLQKILAHNKQEAAPAFAVPEIAQVAG
jgi:UDP-glucose 4-epimerase